MLKIKYLLVSVFLLNIEATFSMEEVKIEINEKTKLLNFKLKSLAATHDKNSNKISLDEFIKKLPNEIWQEIISFLKYEDNRKIFIQFLAPIFGIGDLTAKKIAIDIYRAALINSKGLSNYQRITNNATRSWSNQGNKILVKGYIDMLNKVFMEKNKAFDFSNEDFSTIISSVIDKNKEEVVLKILHYKIQELVHLNKFLSSRDMQVNFGLLEINEKKYSNYSGNVCFDSKSSFKEKTIGMMVSNVLCLLSFFITVYFFVEEFTTPEVNTKKIIIFGVLGSLCYCYCYLPICIWNWDVNKNYCCDDLSSIRIKDTFNFFSELNKSIKDYFEKNNLSLADSDNYFLKLLGHDNRVEDITDINFV